MENSNIVEIVRELLDRDIMSWREFKEPNQNTTPVLDNCKRVVLYKSGPISMVRFVPNYDYKLIIEFMHKDGENIAAKYRKFLKLFEGKNLDCLSKEEQDAGREYEHILRVFEYALSNDYEIPVYRWWIAHAEIQRFLYRKARVCGFVEIQNAPASFINNCR
ncbi:MAG: hypothetical protein FWF34_02480 [Alphaproteobacteria bacterium]|nr:hypothetical protein [Alphaproteobacteria bacterium]MCL2890097.1 hypothetical protein [Alphaproteobacteria bacterium]